ncbi:methyltransferase [Massilia sp. PWRC2]|uniref:methyltransferase n=1 Tax=Massilia sp. PWRC2 TaxID=2804626 RepID=UPI003CE8C931
MSALIVPSAPPAPSFEHALHELAALLRAAGYRFHTVTPATHRRVLARGVHLARDLADAFGWNLPFATALLGEARCAALAAAAIIVRHGDGWKALLRAASLGERIIFHSAYPTEQHDAVFFGPDSYRFVGAIARTLPTLAAPPRRVVEIGCGAGPAAIVIGTALQDAEVIAADINPRALAFTAANASLAGLKNVRTLHSDLLSAVTDDAGRPIDLVLANPPYMLDAGARAYRHGGGGHGEGLALAIVRSALARLAPGGTLMLYTGAPFVRQRDQFLEGAAPLLDGAGCRWHYEELDPDVFGEELEQPGYADVERIAAVWLVAQVPPA